jgi:hypothetical protein
LLISVGDVFGYLALGFIALTAVLMLLRRTLLKYTKNLVLVRKTHIYLSTLGGLFIALHVAFFITYPATTPVIMGYIAASVALVVWVTGTAFLERLKDSLFYHGSLSLAAIGLIVIHATGSGSNIPLWLAGGVLAGTSGVVFWKAAMHAGKLFGKEA